MLKRRNTFGFSPHGRMRDVARDTHKVLQRATNVGEYAAGLLHQQRTAASNPEWT